MSQEDIYHEVVRMNYANYWKGYTASSTPTVPTLTYFGKVKMNAECKKCGEEVNVWQIEKFRKIVPKDAKKQLIVLASPYWEHKDSDDCIRSLLNRLETTDNGLKGQANAHRTLRDRHENLVERVCRLERRRKFLGLF